VCSPGRGRRRARSSEGEVVRPLQRPVGMRPALLSALIAGALAGCSPQAGFSQLGNFQLHFEDTNTGGIDVRFFYDLQAQGCRSLGDDFSATVNGGNVQVFAGGNVSAGAFSFRTECEVPAVAFTRPALLNQGVVLAANAGGEDLEVEIDGLGRTLSGTLVLAQGQVVHAGDRIQVALGGGFERVRWPQSGGSLLDSSNTLRFITFSPPSAEGILDVQLTGDLAPGHTHLRMDFTVDPSFTRCGAPVGCSFDPSIPPRAALDMLFDVAG